MKVFFIENRLSQYLETLNSTDFSFIGSCFPRWVWAASSHSKGNDTFTLSRFTLCYTDSSISASNTSVFCLFWNNLMKLKETGLLWSHIPVTIHSLWSTDVVLFTLFKGLVQNTLCCQTLLSYVDLGFVLMIPLLQFFVIFPWKLLPSLLLLLA